MAHEKRANTLVAHSKGKTLTSMATHKAVKNDLEVLQTSSRIFYALARYARQMETTML
jgi:hypothetical protein